MNNEIMPVNVAVVGVGGWGKNIARNYSEIPSANLRYLCDLDAEKLKKFAIQLKPEKTTRSFEDLLKDEQLHAIIIATPAPTHYSLCKKALAAGKDVYVEKPFVLKTIQARELLDIAKLNNRILMVGHLLKFHPVVRQLKALIDSGELGEIRYIYCQRVNLGTVRADENALWSLAPHDISVILYLLDLKPSDVSARGQGYLHDSIEDVVFLSVNFNNKAMAHIHVSWLDPHKIRRITIVGSNKMATFDDLESTEKLKIYDKGASVSTSYNSFAEYAGLRFGDISIPYIKPSEPLRVECEHFLDRVRDRAQPLTDGLDGLRVVEILEAADNSIKANGSPIVLDTLTNEK